MGALQDAIDRTRRGLSLSHEEYQTLREAGIYTDPTYSRPQDVTITRPTVGNIGPAYQVCYSDATHRYWWIPFDPYA